MTLKRWTVAAAPPVLLTGRFDAHLDEVRRRSEGWPVNQTRKLRRAADPKPLRPVHVE